MENKDEIDTKPAPASDGEGDKPQIPEAVRLANEAAERLEQANKEQRELLDRHDQNVAHEALGGSSDAGQVPVKPTIATPEEYAEKLERGEVNPLHEDGFI